MIALLGISRKRTSKNCADLGLRFSRRPKLCNEPSVFAAVCSLLQPRINAIKKPVIIVDAAALQFAAHPVDVAAVEPVDGLPQERIARDMRQLALDARRRAM